MSKISLTTGAQIFCREWLPVETNGEVVLMLHGVESHSEWFEETAVALNQCGWAVIAYDRPGWGHSDGIPGHIESYDAILNELVEITNNLRQRFSRVHLTGLSWGGMFAAYAALRRGILFDSVVLLAPGFHQKRGFSLGDKFSLAWNIIRHRWLRRRNLRFTPTDFSLRIDKVDYIKNDIWRNYSVTTRFSFETLKMRAFCRQKIARRALPPTTLLLAQNDKILDNVFIRNLVKNTAIRVIEVPRTEHSLVFESPELCAKQIMDTARRPRITGKKIAVLGGGAVGCFIGGMLAISGNRVTIIARNATAEKINHDGLLIKIATAERRVNENLCAVTTLTDRDYDLLIVAVKSYDTESALSALRGSISTKTTIVSLQNGVNNEAKIYALFPQNPVFGGVICVYADCSAPGVVEVVNDQIGLAFGKKIAQRETAENDDNAFSAMLEIFHNSGIETISAENVDSVKWSKLCLNVAFNALNAATGLSIAQVMADKKYGVLAATALKETFAVMRAAKIAPLNLPNYPICFLSYLCRLPVKIIAFFLSRQRGGENAVSSMRQDLRKNSTRTEINEINGVVVRQGEQLGIPAPANRELCDLIAQKITPQ